MPWQRDTLDVLLEFDPDTGLYVHPTALVLVPRQGGKTYETGVLLEERAFTLPRARCWYTAQTQSDAEQWFRDEHISLLEDQHAFTGRYRRRLSQGSHQVSWAHTGSIVRCFSPTRSALHGKQSDLVNLDELWAFTAATGDELLQAIGPTQATRPGAQVVMQSAAGDEASSFLIEQLVAARRDLDNDVDGGVVLIEYGVPDGLDATDPDVAARYHPAVGHTIRPEYLHTERRRLGPEGFARAYGAVQVIPEVTGRVLPFEQWHRGEILEDVRPPVGACALVYDVAHDRSDAAIAAAWTHPDGRTVVALLEHHPATGWLEGRFRELRDQLRAVCGFDAYGPGRDVAGRLERAGVHLEAMTTTDVVEAYEGFLSGHESGTIAHRPAAPLDQSLVIAGRRPIGDAFAWGRRASSGSIAPLVAATNAVWVWEHRPAPGRPTFRSTATR